MHGNLYQMAPHTNAIYHALVTGTFILRYFKWWNAFFVTELPKLFSGKWLIEQVSYELAFKSACVKKESKRIVP